MGVLAVHLVEKAVQFLLRRLVHVRCGDLDGEQVVLEDEPHRVGRRRRGDVDAAQRRDELLAVHADLVVAVAEDHLLVVGVDAVEKLRAEEHLAELEDDLRVLERHLERALVAERAEQLRDGARGEDDVLGVLRRELRLGPAQRQAAAVGRDAGEAPLREREQQAREHRARGVVRRGRVGGFAEHLLHDALVELEREPVLRARDLRELARGDARDLGAVGAACHADGVGLLRVGRDLDDLVGELADDRREALHRERDLARLEHLGLARVALRDREVRRRERQVLPLGRDEDVGEHRQRDARPDDALHGVEGLEQVRLVELELHGLFTRLFWKSLFCVVEKES